MKCIRKSHYHLTPGRIYEVDYDITDNEYNDIAFILTNDKGYEHYIYKDELDIFIDINTHREKIISKLLED